MFDVNVFIRLVLYWMEIVSKLPDYTLHLSFSGCLILDADIAFILSHFTEMWVVKSFT